jgi:hypothetical protein
MMATYAENRTYSNLDADEAFQILVRTLPEMGYAVWKTRPIGWLIIANREFEQGKVNATVSLRPGAGAQLNLSLACNEMEQEELKGLAQELLQAIDQRLT